MTVTRTDSVEALKSRTGLAEEALDLMSTEALAGYYNKTVNPALWIGKMFVAAPFLATAFYTAASGRLLMGGILAAAGGYAAFSAKSDYEKNQAVTTDISRTLAAKIA